MNTADLNQFHDGWLDGLLVDSEAVEFFMRAHDKRSFVLRLEGVEALSVEGFKQGNIIFDVVVRAQPEITCSDLVELCGYQNETDANIRLEQLSPKSLIVEINPSYGASCLVLAKGMLLNERYTS